MAGRSVLIHPLIQPQSEVNDMAFSNETQRKARQRAGGFCECRRKEHAHIFGRCVSPLMISGAEFHHKTAVNRGGSDGLSNCEVLCRSCHRKTNSYGRR